MESLSVQKSRFLVHNMFNISLLRKRLGAPKDKEKPLDKYCESQASAIYSKILNSKYPSDDPQDNRPNSAY